MIDLKAQLRATLKRINDAEQRFGRSPDSVKLLAISKGHSASRIAEVADMGLLEIGENYVQEALHKISALSQKPIVWHFVGVVQAKKAAILAQNFSWVHTVYRVNEAERLSHFRSPDLPPLNICIQVKLDESATKSGILPAEVPTLYHAIKSLPHIQIRGLMTLPPQSDNFEEQRKFFKQLHELMTELNQSGAQLDTLSMGMTHDLEAAIAEGATLVRVGTGIFGERRKNHHAT
ncbi:MAG: YggS family pyridoxal phosphate-dependent enzyme [Candidatus Berkiellales bacterium]